jgi:leader peptidase (prepilin peptidase)/N-methyltransferase
MVDAFRLTFFLVLLAIAWVDVRQRVVYWHMVGPAIAVAIVLGPAGIISGLAGLVATISVFTAIYVVGRWLYPQREPLGLGDVGIAALVGAVAGFPLGLLALLGGSVAAGTIAAAALITRRARLDSYLPYGPGLCLGGMVALCLIPSA